MRSTQALSAPPPAEKAAYAPAPPHYKTNANACSAGEFRVTVKETRAN